MKIQLRDIFSEIEGELITAFEGYITDDKGTSWRYARHRRHNQSIEEFKQEIIDTYEEYGLDEFRKGD